MSRLALILNFLYMAWTLCIRSVLEIWPAALAKNVRKLNSACTSTYIQFARIMGYTIVVHDPHGVRPRMKTTSAIWVSNHQMWTDIAAMMQSIDGCSYFVAKKSLLFVPVFGFGMWLADNIFISRGSGRSAIEAICSWVRRKMAGPEAFHLVGFPEGTRRSELGPFKAGMFIVSRAFDLPVVPVSIRYDHTIKCIWTYIHEPVDPRAHDSVESLADYCRLKIASELNPSSQ